MPYKSLAQEHYFNAHRKELEAQGVNIDEWNSASKGRSLPQHKGPNMKKDDGLEGLTKPREDKKSDEGGSKKAEKKKPAASHPKGHKLRRIVTTALHDGTYHHEHHYEDERGVPSRVEEGSTVSADDAGAHVAEQFGGGQGSQPMQEDPEESQSPVLAAQMGGQ